MSAPFVAEIRMFAGNFAPKGWAFCDGQLIPISQNTALFSLLGTTYGGDGRSTFALPNLRGSSPVQPGQGPGLSDRFLGETGGATSVTLTSNQIPAHGHDFKVSSSAANDGVPSPVVTPAVTPFKAYGGVQDMTDLGDAAGGSQPHNNRQPYLAVSFIIALQGVFPPRS